MEMRRRIVSVWSADHDNGWTTTVSENPDGTSAAWAAPRNTTMAVDYIEDEPEHARIAPEYA
jgi:hypothetical protein